MAVELSEVELRAKQRALSMYHTQVEPLSDLVGDEAVVPPGFRGHFCREREVFVDATVVHRRRPGGPNRLPVTGVGGEIQPGSRLLRRFLSAGADQWGFQTRWCDITQDITLASLPPERFASAFEPGCAIGFLTSELAERCDRVLATDVSPAPLTIARRRLAGRAGVRLQRLRVPQAWPPGRFDLVVLSEIGYYCGTVDLTQLIAVASSSLTDDGLLPTAIGGIRWRTVR